MQYAGDAAQAGEAATLGASWAVLNDIDKRDHAPNVYPMRLQTVVCKPPALPAVGTLSGGGLSE